MVFVQDNQSMSPKGVLCGLHFQKQYSQTKLVRSEVAEFCYKCDEFYHPNGENGMIWNDPEIGIIWLGVTDEYKETASAEGYCLDGET